MLILPKTAGLIKVIGGRSIASRVNYNRQVYKTEGSWLNDNYDYNQSELISFCDNSALPGLSLQQQGNKLINDGLYNIRSAMDQRPYSYWNKSWSQCYTIVQSFDYVANPQLSPKNAHAMGVHLYNDIKLYMKARYGYAIDDGMISTHLDDNKPHKNKHTGLRVHPHLHNHIIIPSYNGYGRSASPYLREYDLYQFKGFNDSILASPQYNLNNYYFAKLQRLGKAYQTYKLTDKPRRNPERGWLAFKVANDYAWDKNKPMDSNGRITEHAFKETVHSRNQYLSSHFQFEMKLVPDIKTGKPRRTYTMGIFPLDSHKNRPWLSMRSLRILQWLDRKEMKAERLYWQLDFKGTTDKIMSFQTYEKAMRLATQKLPSLNRINSPQARQQSHISLFKCYEAVKPYTQSNTQASHIYVPEPKNATNLGRYAKKTLLDVYTKAWIAHHMKYYTHAHNYLVTDTSNLINRANLIHNRARIKAAHNIRQITPARTVNKKPQRHHNQDVQRGPQR